MAGSKKQSRGGKGKKAEAKKGVADGGAAQGPPAPQSSEVASVGEKAKQGEAKQGDMADGGADRGSPTTQSSEVVPEGKEAKKGDMAAQGPPASQSCAVVPVGTKAQKVRAKVSFIHLDTVVIDGEQRKHGSFDVQ